MAVFSSNADLVRQLEGELVAAEQRIATLEELQSNSLRIVFGLPPTLASMVELKTLSAGLVSDDGKGMTYVLSDTIILTVEPFAERITLSDPKGVHQPLTVSLKGDFTTDKVLQINGYVTLVKRDGVGQTATDWGTTLDTAVFGAPA